MSTEDDIYRIVQLVTKLSPIAIGLTKRLMEGFSGKTDDEILAEADTAFADVIAKAKKELGQ